MPVALLPYEAVALAAMCKALRGSALQTRKPTYEVADFWSKPIFTSSYTPVDANTDWQDLVVVAGQPQFVAILKQYVATTLGSVAASGLLFRMALDGLPLNTVSLAAGLDINKDSPTSYPVVPRKFFMAINETHRLSIQVKNPTNFQQMAVGLLVGWYMTSVDSTVTADSNAIAGTVYQGLVGVPNGDN
jgi:hypothetical protein